MHIVAVSLVALAESCLQQWQFLYKESTLKKIFTICNQLICNWLIAALWKLKYTDNAVFYRSSWKEIGLSRGTGFIRNSRILIQIWSNLIWFTAFNLVLFVTQNTCSNLLCPRRDLNLWGFKPLFIEENILKTVRGFIKLPSTLEDYTLIQSA